MLDMDITMRSSASNGSSGGQATVTRIWTRLVPRVPGPYWVRVLPVQKPRLVYVVYNADMRRWEVESFRDLTPMWLDQSFSGAWWWGPLDEPSRV